MIRSGMVIQWPDTHVPDHNPKAVASLLNFIQEQDPAGVILTGDFLDCLPVGRWSADTLEEAGKLMQREITVGRGVLEDLRNVYDGPVWWLPGNHEERLAKWGRKRGKGVFGIDALTIPALLGFDDLAIEAPCGRLEATGTFEFAPGVIAIHGERLGMKAGYSVTKELERFGYAHSIVMGHCHRQAVVYRSIGSGVVFGVEGGHLMDQRKASYLTYGAADWQTGFAVIHVNGRRSVPQLVPMNINGSFTFDNVKYAA